jgi:hypothetical protein
VSQPDPCSTHVEVEKDWRPVDVWLDILEAFDSNEAQHAIEARKEFEDKYLVRGQLLVTTAQYAELQRIAWAQEFEDQQRPNPFGIPRPPRISDVPIRLVTELPIDLGGGLKAIHAHGRIYVFREVDYQATMTWGGEQAPLTEKELTGDGPNHQSDGSTGDGPSG